LRHAGVFVGDHIFTPRPVGGLVLLEGGLQTLGKRLQHGASGLIVRELPEVVIQTQNGERPRARTRHALEIPKRQAEEIFSQQTHGLVWRMGDQVAQRPLRAALTVVAPIRLQPGAIVAHEVAEAAAAPRSRVVQNARYVCSGPRTRSSWKCAHDHRGHDNGSGVVIGGVAVAPVRRRVHAVLQNAHVVGHREQNAEPHFRQ
jgi:hypothetical protein